MNYLFDPYRRSSSTLQSVGCANGQSARGDTHGGESGWLRFPILYFSLISIQAWREDINTGLLEGRGIPTSNLFFTPVTHIKTHVEGEQYLKDTGGS